MMPGCHLDRFVQPHPPAPQDQDAGLSVALAPEVAAEFAEHPHDLSQGERLRVLGVMASWSRPAVSNDNPYSESLFKVLKYP